MKRLRVAAFLLCLGAVAHAGKPAEIEGQPWSGSIFDKARKEHRFVLLDLGAVRCHWCHVMEDERECALPNPDVQYPQFEKTAGFICTDRRCSAPIFDPAKITTVATRK